MKHLPEEDYWRVKIPLNGSVHGGKGFTDEEYFKIIRSERKLLEKMEQDAYAVFNR